MLDRIDDLIGFARIVEAGSLTGAAARMGVSKAMVSRRLGALEDALGARLFHRTTRRLALTDAGSALYEHAVRILQEAELARLAVEQLKSEPAGTLRLTTSTVVGRLHVVPAMADFLARYPAIDIQLTLSDRYVDLADEGFDLAIRLTDDPPDATVARPLAPVRFVLVAAPDYLANAAPIRRPEDLAGHDCLSYSLRPGEAEWMLDGTGGERRVRVRNRLSVNNSECVRDMVLAGAGVALLPTMVVWRELGDGTLVRLLPRWVPRGPLASTMYAVWLPNRYPQPKIRAFVDFIAERFGNGAPYWDAPLPAKSRR